MDGIDLLALKSELVGTKCELDHGKGIEPGDATDYLTVPMGTKTGVVETQTDTLTIPICTECAEALCGDEWILIYCLCCGASHWVARKYARRSYPTDCHIVWKDNECPKCWGSA